MPPPKSTGRDLFHEGWLASHLARQPQPLPAGVVLSTLCELTARTAAEALARLPGVSVERDQGEGRFVRVRGLGADFNAVNINGAITPASEAARRAPGLDLVPSGLIRALNYIEREPVRTQPIFR